MDCYVGSDGRYGKIFSPVTIFYQLWLHQVMMELLPLVQHSMFLQAFTLDCYFVDDLVALLRRGRDIRLIVDEVHAAWSADGVRCAVLDAFETHWVSLLPPKWIVGGSAAAAAASGP